MKRMKKAISLVLLYAFSLDGVLAHVKGAARQEEPVAARQLPLGPPAAIVDQEPALANVSDAAGAARGLAAFDLTTWTQRGDADAGLWDVADEGRRVTQKLAAGPTFLIGPAMPRDFILRARVKANGNVEPGSAVGLVLGYRISQSRGTTQSTFILLDWAAQSSEVLALSKLQGGDIGGARDLTKWRRSVLGTGRVGWTTGAEHALEVRYTRGGIAASVDGRPVLDVKGSFPKGAIGLYTSSLAAVTFRDVVDLSLTPEREGLRPC